MASEMTQEQAKQLSDRWHSLSLVCWCRERYLCSACREQDAIEKQTRNAGWNIFTMQRVIR